jgi:hypothetical protein
MHLSALPMHGEIKMRREGLRTRDGHLLEHFAAMDDLTIEVLSRPEPFPRVTLARRSGREVMPARLQFRSPQIVAVPSLQDRRRWWVTSASKQALPSADSEGMVLWNPLGSAHVLRQLGSRRPPAVFDLLDDWRVHDAFAGIQEEVIEAYRTVMQEVDAVTANSEATEALAHEFGRKDAILLRNGCEPSLFRTGADLPHDPVIVGYGGKLGHRIDFEIMVRAIELLPEVQFDVAGPEMERGAADVLKRFPNVRLLGDVAYSRYPELVKTWSIGWVPHRTGAGEVGGDVMKIYEYRAAGLPTLITPIIGSDRALPGVTVAERSDFPERLQQLVSRIQQGDHRRDDYEVPDEMTWGHKARAILGLLR